MKVKTNMPIAAIAAYNAMLWNHGEAPYTVSTYGDTLESMLSDAGDDLELLEASYLVSDTAWHIETQESLRDDEFGDKKAVEYYAKNAEKYVGDCKGDLAKWKAATKEIAAFKREFAAWRKRWENVKVEPYEIDLDEIDIAFEGKLASGEQKAVADVRVSGDTRLNCGAGK